MSKQSSNELTVMLASGTASIISTIVCNPFEVLKIRQQSSSLGCDIHNHEHQQRFRYIHEVALSGSVPRVEKYSWLTRFNVQDVNSRNPFVKIYQRCSCLDSKSLAKAIKQIYRSEGPLTFFNGWRYAVLQSAASNVLYFSFYEKFKYRLQSLDNRVLTPMIASSLARALTTTITFPLEYWKVLQSSYSGYTQKKNVQLGVNINSAYIVTIQRDVLFSCLYWPLLENIKVELPIKNQQIVNFLSGVIAGCITAVVTLPLDVVKTRKQVATRNDIGNTAQSTMNIMRGIYIKEGIPGLFNGVQPRIMKVTLHSGLVYMMYEELKNWFRF